MFNYTDTKVTETVECRSTSGVSPEYACALPRVRWHVGVTEQRGLAAPALTAGSVISAAGTTHDSGYATVFMPSDVVENGFFKGRPILDLRVLARELLPTRQTVSVR